jgi:hypothetical protein
MWLLEKKAARAAKREEEAETRKRESAVRKRESAARKLVHTQTRAEKRKRDTRGGARSYKRARAPSRRRRGQNTDTSPEPVALPQLTVEQYMDALTMRFQEDAEVQMEKLRARIGAMHASVTGMTARHQFRERADAMAACEEMRKELRIAESDAPLQAYLAEARPFTSHLSHVAISALPPRPTKPTEPTTARAKRAKKKNTIVAKKSRVSILKVHYKDASGAGVGAGDTDVKKEVKDEEAVTPMVPAAYKCAANPKMVTLRDEGTTVEECRAQAEEQLRAVMERGGHLGAAGAAVNTVVPVYMASCDMCPTCSEPMVIMGAGALLGCKRCKQTHAFIQPTSSRIAYGEEVEFTAYSYNPENHFQDGLNYFQAKEQAVVPLEVLQTVMVRLVTDHMVRSPSDVTLVNVRLALKKLKLSKYYDNTQQITTRLCGRAAPALTPQQEEQVRCMFSAVVPKFNKFKPDDRKNHMSYKCMTYKFFQLLGWDHLLPALSLLKGADKRRKQDVTYVKVCESLDWEHVPFV